MGLMPAILRACAVAITWVTLVSGADTRAGETAAPNPATTDSTTTAPIDLDACIAQAVTANPEVKAAFARWQAAVEQVPQAAALPDPSLILETVTQQESPEHRVGLRQELPPPGLLRAESGMAAREAAARRHQFEAEQFKAVYTVREAYYECRYLDASIAFAREALELVTGLEQTLRDRYAASAAAHPDVLRTQAEAGTIGNEVRTLEDMRPVLSARLRSAMGLAPDGPLLWPSAEIADPTAPDERAVLDAIAQANPELKAARERVYAADFGRRRARALSWPAFMLGVKGMRMEGGSDMGDNEYPVEVMLEMSIPLNMRKNGARRRQATAMAREADAMRTAEDYRLQTAAKDVLYRYRDATRRVTLVQESLIPKQEEAVRAMRTAFAASNTPFVDLIEAHRTLLDLRRMQERARTDRLEALAELDMLLGRGLPPGAQPAPEPAAEAPHHTPAETTP